VKLLFLTTPREYFTPASGGAVATVTDALAHEAAQLGHEVKVAARSDANPPYPSVPFVSLGRIPWPDSPAMRVRWAVAAAQGRIKGWHWPDYGGYLKALRRVLSDGDRPDAIVYHNDPFVTPTLRQHAPESTTVLWVHNELGERSWRALRSCVPDHIVAVSGFIKGRVLAATGLPEGKILVFHNGVDHETFHPRPGYDEPVDRPRVIVLGRVDPRKGTDVAVRAVRDLVAEGASLDLTVVGSPWFYKAGRQRQSPWVTTLLEDIAAAGGTHLPHVTHDEVPALLRAHDIAMVLSRWEDPCPLTVPETMASGCALIASRRGGIPEVAADGALIVEPEDRDEVGGALRQLTTDPATLSRAKQDAVRRGRDLRWGTSALLDLLGAHAENDRRAEAG
jgi:glycosyltransferase involved in cell wall biosynthesis